MEIIEEKPTQEHVDEGNAQFDALEIPNTAGFDLNIHIRLLLKDSVAECFLNHIKGEIPGLIPIVIGSVKAALTQKMSMMQGM